MLKKSSIIGTFIFIAACSSTPVSNEYDKDAVVGKNIVEGHTQIVGKKIVPIGLLENNLGLSISELNVVVSIGHSQTKEIESKINVEIEYSEVNTDSRKPNYDVVMIDDLSILLEEGDISRDCNNETCVVTQRLSFPIETALLENGQKDGVRFILLQSEKTDAQLETMIPGRYLTALFSG